MEEDLNTNTVRCCRSIQNSLDAARGLLVEHGIPVNGPAPSVETFLDEFQGFRLPEDCEDFDRIGRIEARILDRANATVKLFQSLSDARSSSSKGPSRVASSAASSASAGSGLQRRLLERLDQFGGQTSGSMDMVDRRRSEVPTTGILTPRRRTLEFERSAGSSSPATEPEATPKRRRTLASTAPTLDTTASGAPFRIEDDWPLEVRIFYPELGRANAATCLACSALDSTARILFGELDGTVVDMSSTAFEKALCMCVRDILDAVNSHDTSDSQAILNQVLKTLLSLAPLQTALVSARNAVKRAFDLYTLATQTSGASWLTVEQLVYREIFDAQKARYDPTYQPLQAWDNKVAAALTACKQSNAMSKDGLLLGPVAPSVARALGKRDNAFRDATPSTRRPTGSGPQRLGSRARLSFRGGKGKPPGGAATKTKPKTAAARKQDAGTGQPDGSANQP